MAALPECTIDENATFTVRCACAFRAQLTMDVQEVKTQLLSMPELSHVPTISFLR